MSHGALSGLVLPLLGRGRQALWITREPQQEPVFGVCPSSLFNSMCPSLRSPLCACSVLRVPCDRVENSKRSSRL